ncbi:hypothetical protein COOONC_18020 [Cooperia oncophora]
MAEQERLAYERQHHQSPEESPERGLSKELSKRLVADQVKNKRTAENVVFGILNDNQTSKTLKIASYSPQVLAEIMWSAAKAFNRAPSGSDQWDPPIYNLSMSASRFVDGVSAQNQSIMEWVEKRLKLSEAGNSMFEPANNPAPEPRIFVKGVLKRPTDKEVAGPSGGMSSASNSPIKTTPKKKKPDTEAEVKVDEDGWQVYDPALFEAPSNALPAVELNDIGEISSAVFQELPDNIKAVCFSFHCFHRKVSSTLGDGDLAPRVNF